MKQIRPDVLVVSSEFPPSNVPETDHAVKLCNQLAKKGFKLELITSKRAPAPDKQKYDYAIHDCIKRWSWTETVKLVNMIVSRRPCCLFILYVSHMYYFNKMILFLPLLIKMRLRNCRIVTQFENTAYPIFIKTPLNKKRLQGKILKRIAYCIPIAFRFGSLIPASDHIITLCEQHRKAILGSKQKLLAKSSVISSPPFEDTPDQSKIAALRKYREELGIDSETTVLCFFGFLYQGKGIEYLIEAVKMIRDKGHKIKVLLIGGIVGIEYGSHAKFSQLYVEKLQGLLKKYNLEDLFILTGRIQSEAEVSQYIACGDIAVFPLDQGIRLNNGSYITVALHGLPVVTTRSADTDESFIDKENILLCEPKNPGGLYEKVLYLIKNPDEKLRLSKNSLKFAKQNFSLESIVVKTMQALNL